MNMHGKLLLWFSMKVNCNFTTQISFVDFNVELDRDYIAIYDGESHSADALLGVFSGNTLPGNLHSSSNILLIHFVSDGYQTQTGWMLEWTTAGMCKSYFYVSYRYF